MSTVRFLVRSLAVEFHAAQHLRLRCLAASPQVKQALVLLPFFIAHVFFSFACFSAARNHSAPPSRVNFASSSAVTRARTVRSRRWSAGTTGRPRCFLAGAFMPRSRWPCSRRQSRSFPSRETGRTVSGCNVFTVAQQPQSASIICSARNLTIPSNRQPPEYRRLRLMSNVSALQRSMKRSPVRCLASSCAATQRAGRKSCTSRHSSIGAARYGALPGVRLSLPGSLRAEDVTGEQPGFFRGALRLRSTAAPRPEQYTSVRVRGRINTNTGLT